MSNMKNLIYRILLSSTALLCISVLAHAQGSKETKSENSKEKTVTKHATGTFEVKVTPLAPEDNVGDPKIGRLSLDKQFSGGITAVSKGQMLGYQSETPGTGGYLSIRTLKRNTARKKSGICLHPK